MNILIPYPLGSRVVVEVPPWNASFTTKISAVNRKLLEEEKNEDKRAIIRKFLAEEEAKGAGEPDASERQVEVYVVPKAASIDFQSGPIW